MRKVKILAIAGLACVSTISISKPIISSDKSLDVMSPVGYWVQFDEDDDAGNGFVQGVVQAHFSKKTGSSKNGALEMKIVVPIMNVIDGKMSPPKINCTVCGVGEINGFK